MFARSDIYFRLRLLLIIIHISCISLSLRWTSVPIHLTSVLGVLGTQETSCIVIVGLFERDTFDLFLPEFDKPWVIHLRETCRCSTNLCTWRPNIIYKNRIVRRHQLAWFKYSYSRDMRFSTYDLSSIYLVFVLALTLTTQDAYDRGNERSKLISTIIFVRFMKLAITTSLYEGPFFYFYVESSSSNFMHRLREHSCHSEYNVHSPKIYYWLIHDYGIACSQIICI
jgi:hypothetical protein